jgi:hypothetical protein
MTRQCYTVALLAGLALVGCNGSSPTTSAPPKTPEPTGPIAAVKNKVLQTSIEDTAKTYDFAFAFANRGDQPLQLKLLKKSCSCTAVEVPKGPIPAGQSANVVFHWSPLITTTPAYTSWAEIQTNDHRTPQVHLELQASVHPLIRVSPRLPFLDFENLRPGATGQMTLTVYSLKLPAFDLDAAASPALEITKTKLAEGAAVEDVQALSGYQLVLQTTDKLPPNYFRDDLVLTVKVPNREPHQFTLPVYALRETGAFTIVPTQVEFHKPLVTEEDSKKVLVRFLVPSDQDRVEVVKVEPSFLTATAPVKVGPGEWRFEVKLPRDNAEAAQFQPDSFLEGRLLLKISGAAADVPVRIKWEPESK